MYKVIVHDKKMMLEVVIDDESAQTSDHSDDEFEKPEETKEAAPKPKVTIGIEVQKVDDSKACIQFKRLAGSVVGYNNWFYDVLIGGIADVVNDVIDGETQ